MIRPEAGARLRLGIDLGGTKIAGIVLDATGAVLCEDQVRTPRGDYAATLRALADMVQRQPWLEESFEFPVEVDRRVESAAAAAVPA